MLKGSFTAIDIETTGLNPDACDIIEIAAVRFSEGEGLQKIQALAQPREKIPLKIKKLTGISDEMVSSARNCSEVLEELIEFVGDSIVIGHNVEFDLGFLSRRKPWFTRVKSLDTLQISRFAWPMAPGYRLESLINYLKLEVDGHPHRAEHDAMAAKEIFCLAAAGLQSMGYDVLLKVLQLAEAYPQWSFQDYFSGLVLQGPQFTIRKRDNYFIKKEEPSKGDGLFSDLGKDCVSKCKSDVMETEEALVGLIGPNGGFSKTLPDFQYRPQQADMLKEILHCFKQQKYAVIEAGTGTGKSLAYLLPALYWNRHNGTRVVVATHTINLQEQLLNKDLPYIESVLGKTVNAALVKGRSNYLCLRKWEQRTQDKGWVDEKELNFHVKCMLWLAQTTTGDKSELNLRGDEKELWQDLAGETESCLGNACKWCNNCYGMKARRKAENAELLIVNHSLVFADIKSDNNVLPDYHYIIIDEAHHIEDSATEYLGYEISGSSLHRLLKYLKKDIKYGRPGLIARVKAYLGQGLEGYPDLLQMATGILDEIVSARKDSEIAREDFLEQAHQFVGLNGASDDYSEQSGKLVRIKPDHKETAQWLSLQAAGENLVIRIKRLINGLDKVSSCFFSEELRDEDREAVSLSKELQYMIGHLKDFAVEMKFIMAVDDGSFVYWFQTFGYKNDVVMKAAPIKISDLLWDRFLKEKNSVILTSATLSVDGNFQYYVNKTGLGNAPPDAVQLLSVPTPFEYDKQSILCIVNDLPNPSEVDDHVYAEEIAPVLAQLARTFQGRTLCLFSSHRLLKETYDRLIPLLEDEDIALLGHNIDGGRKGLVEEFKKSGKFLLMGASSFWEGVDIPGDLLSCVVIVKLPFSPPTIPTLEARIEQLQSENIDGFYHYSLPQAVIRLKQGFGRLIRKETDYGAVVILDKRIIQKRYGRIFLHSLPLKRHFKGDRYCIAQKIRDWMEEGGNNQEIPLYINDFSAIDRFIKEKLKTKKDKTI